MGLWILKCPKCGPEEVLVGECTYEKRGREFILRCPHGLRREGGITFLNPQATHRMEVKGVFEATSVLYKPLERATGIEASENNLVWTPEVVGTVVGDVLYDTIFGKVGSALMNLLTGVLIEAGVYLGRDKISDYDKKFLHELAAHHITRVGRLASPGEFSLALGEAKDLGAALRERRFADISRILVKSREALSLSLEEIRRKWEELVAPVAPPAPAPAPAVPPAVPAVPVEEVL